MSWQSHKQQPYCSISGYIFSCSCGKRCRERISSSLLLLISTKTTTCRETGKYQSCSIFLRLNPKLCLCRIAGWVEEERFVKPADPINYTFTLIRFSLSGCQETEHIAQFICWPVGQLSLDKRLQASCEGSHPAFCWRSYCSSWAIPGCFEKLRVF